MPKQQTTKKTTTNITESKQAKTNILLAQNEFSSALFSQVVDESAVDSNVIISPFSIYLAMINCMMATGGNTLKEMINGLFLKDSFDSCKMNDFNEQFQQWKESELKQYSTMIKKIVQNQDVLSIANRIYVEKSVDIKSEFIQELEDQFDSETQLANFKNGTKSEVSKINNWVASITKNSIRNLITELDKETLMVLVNAIYFNGKWKHQFLKNRTVETAFRTVKDPEGDSTNCQMMSLEDCKSNFYFEEIEDCHILKLPYTDEDYCMLIIKPDDSIDVDEENEISFNKWINSKLTDITQIYPKEMVKMRKIRIPKFKFEKQFANIISKMSGNPFNIKSLFNSNTADFSNMLSNPNTDGIYVDQIIHKACIEVDECGTVASAATAISARKKSKSSSSEKVYEFIADRPFAFVLNHIPTQSVLFVGKINQIN
ncbi:predicted protein [Naegleria gruberi]|uniref:Predicted protein n=1 Tax=Naegleria gruberi TaxID=5762 RepID=D2VNS8_NAEGR|nr:uncharacterized protein NAEGRDRAFT_70605 [Naegleria gruberi]EFC41466.1 predicted protein [Naegleria gruberi]|eukprot:XP_002674210.1 predicted protein [Naegleria gruberi strain NEG-M]